MRGAAESLCVNGSAMFVFASGRTVLVLLTRTWFDDGDDDDIVRVYSIVAL